MLPNKKCNCAGSKRCQSNRCKCFKSRLIFCIVEWMNKALVSWMSVLFYAVISTQKLSTIDAIVLFTRLIPFQLLCLKCQLGNQVRMDKICSLSAVRITIDWIIWRNWSRFVYTLHYRHQLHIRSFLLKFGSSQVWTRALALCQPSTVSMYELWTV